MGGPERIRRMCEGMAEQLASIHSVDVAAGSGLARRRPRSPRPELDRLGFRDEPGAAGNPARARG